MESKWYLFPGQTVENTKISDRAHALHITKKAWGGITKHLDRKRLIQQALDKELNHRKALKEGSEAMTKEWKNSIENLRITKEQARQERIDKKKDDKIQMYYKMRAEQEVVRQEYVEKVKKGMFISSGFPKQLTSALMLSETLYEREKQKEFNEMLRKHDADVERQNAEMVKANDEKGRQENEEKARKVLEKNRKMGEALKEQILKREMKTREENRRREEKEAIDFRKAEEEMQMLKQLDFEEKQRKRREMRREQMKELEDLRQRRQVSQKEEKEMEEAGEIYANAKKRINCLMKTKEQKRMADSLAKREAIVAKVAAIKQEAGKVAEIRLMTAIAEHDAQEKLKMQAKKEFLAKVKQDRIDDRKQYLERIEQEKRNEEELKKWEMLNRIKTDEAMKEYDIHNKREKWTQILMYRNELLEQIAQVKEEQKQEKETERILSIPHFEETDEMFFKYANEVMELAKSKNRPTHPIEKVVMEYKKTYGLLPKDKQCRCCRKINSK